MVAGAKGAQVQAVDEAAPVAAGTFKKQVQMHQVCLVDQTVLTSALPYA
jgi:hypothetical protein